MARPLSPLNLAGEDMFVILAYDVRAKRCAKVMKYLRRWLQHHQRSLFAGFLTDANVEHMKRGLMKLIDPRYDSVIMYKTNRAEQVTQWRTLGAMIRSIEGVAADSGGILQSAELPKEEEKVMRVEFEERKRRKKAKKRHAVNFVQPGEKREIKGNAHYDGQSYRQWGVSGRRMVSPNPEGRSSKPKKKRGGWNAG